MDCAALADQIGNARGYSAGVIALAKLDQIAADKGHPSGSGAIGSEMSRRALALAIILYCKLEDTEAMQILAVNGWAVNGALPLLHSVKNCLLHSI